MVPDGNQLPGSCHWCINSENSIDTMEMDDRIHQRPCYVQT
jgi:hypothetical protein